MTLSKLLKMFPSYKKAGAGFLAPCPAHDDDKSSLSISEKGDRILINCHASCNPEDVCRALGIELRDLFTSQASVSNAGTSEASVYREIAAYPYVDEDGGILYENVRFHPKDFLQRRVTDSGGREWGLNGTRRVPYRLPQLLKNAADLNRMVFMAEGERDADTLASLGLTATNLKTWRREFNRYLGGVRVVILCDHDEPGLKLAHKTMELVQSEVRSVKIVDLFADAELPRTNGKDVTDWVTSLREKGSGNEVITELLLQAVAESSEVKPSVPGLILGRTLRDLCRMEFPPREEIIAGLARGENGLLNSVTKSVRQPSPEIWRFL